MNAAALLVFLVATSAQLHAEQSTEVARNEALQLSRIAPADFPGLPEAIVAELNDRGCSIPQSYVVKKPNNAIQGHFFRAGELAWAVLCSRDNESSIFVIPADNPQSMDEISSGRKEDLVYETFVDGSLRFGFGRTLWAVGEKYIVDRYDAYGGRKPPPIDHDGINDGYFEKASVVQYRFESEWPELSGAD